MTSLSLLAQCREPHQAWFTSLNIFRYSEWKRNDTCVYLHGQFYLDASAWKNAYQPFRLNKTKYKEKSEIKTETMDFGERSRYTLNYSFQIPRSSSPMPKICPIVASPPITPRILSNSSKKVSACFPLKARLSYCNLKRYPINIFYTSTITA